MTHSHCITRITMVNHKTTLPTMNYIPSLGNKAGSMRSQLLVEGMLITQQKREHGKRRVRQWPISILEIKVLDMLVLGRV